MHRSHVKGLCAYIQWRLAGQDKGTCSGYNGDHYGSWAGPCLCLHPMALVGVIYSLLRVDLPLLPLLPPIFLRWDNEPYVLSTGWYARLHALLLWVAVRSTYYTHSSCFWMHFWFVCREFETIYNCSIVQYNLLCLDPSCLSCMYCSWDPTHLMALAARRVIKRRTCNAFERYAWRCYALSKVKHWAR